MTTQKTKPILKFVESHLGKFISRHGFVIGENNISEMGEWYVRLNNKEFTVTLARDRGGHEAIVIGSKLRPRPRAHMREWSLSHLRGFLEGNKDHYLFSGFKDQIDWLEKNECVLLDSSMLNSAAMNKWAVKASRRLFGQESRM